MGFHVLVDYFFGPFPLGNFTTNSTNRGAISPELDILQDLLFGHFSGRIIWIKILITCEAGFPV